MKIIYLLLFCLFYSSMFSAQTGSCINPNSPFFYVNEGSWSQIKGPDTSKCISNYEIINGQIKTYFSVKSSKVGSLGLLHTISFNLKNGPSNDTTCLPPTTIFSSRKARLFKSGDCEGTDINYDKLISNSSYSSTFNPEWSNLTPSTDYILEIIVNVPSYCNDSIRKIQFLCTDIYYPNETISCSANLGVLSVLGGVVSNESTYNLINNSDSIKLLSENYILPEASNGNFSSIGYFIFDQKPNLPFNDITPNAIQKLPGFKGVVKGNKVEDINNGGFSKSVPGAKILWFVPALFDKTQDGMSIDDNLDGCYKVGSSIQVNYSQNNFISSCGKCIETKCPIVSVKAKSSFEGSNLLSNSADYNFGNNYSVEINNQPNNGIVFSNFYDIELFDSTLLLGIKQKVLIKNFSSTNNIYRKAILRKTCYSDSIPSSKYNANNIQSSFNPEWENLAKGKYVLEIISSLGDNVEIGSSVAGFYYVLDSLNSNPTDTIKTNSLKKNNELHDFVFFPNPVKDLLYFKNLVPEDLVVTDCLGRKIKLVMKDEKTIDFSLVENGVYQINIDNSTYQFIISH